MLGYVGGILLGVGLCWGDSIGCWMTKHPIESLHIIQIGLGCVGEIIWVLGDILLGLVYVQLFNWVVGCFGRDSIGSA